MTAETYIFMMMGVVSDQYIIVGGRRGIISCIIIEVIIYANII